MSDCDHVWMVHSITYKPMCLKCHEEMEADEIERRINATECLSAEDAESIAFGLPDEYSMLNDYARKLKVWI